MTRFLRVLLFASGVAATTVSTASGAVTPEQKCEATKLKLAGKNAACRAAALAKTAVGRVGDVGKCDMKLTTDFAKVNAKGVCPPSGDAASIAATVAGTFVAIDRLLIPPIGRFVDNGDGTVTDTQTGLQWVQHGYDVGSQWSRDCGDSAPTGDLFRTFLNNLNIDCLAGHCDWRIPTIEELETIAGTGGACVPEFSGAGCLDPVFGPTLTTYWSSTTDERYPDQALVEYFLPIAYGSLEASWPKCDAAVPPHDILLLGARGVRTVGSPPSLCQPASTCATQGASFCGTFVNDCGFERYCGCEDPQTCGGAGNPNQCGCTPNATCPPGDNCGTAPDGCGGTIGCGTCTAPQTCGGGGVPNQCGCTDNGLACSNAGAICGTRTDNCGVQVSCGTCPFNQPKCCITSCVCAACACP
jgi:hypothetical protein